MCVVDTFCISCKDGCVCTLIDVCDILLLSTYFDSQIYNSCKLTGPGGVGSSKI